MARREFEIKAAFTRRLLQYRRRARCFFLAQSNAQDARCQHGMPYGQWRLCLQVYFFYIGIYEIYTMARRWETPFDRMLCCNGREQSKGGDSKCKPLTTQQQTSLVLLAYMQHGRIDALRKHSCLCVAEFVGWYGCPKCEQHEALPHAVCGVHTHIHQHQVSLHFWTTSTGCSLTTATSLLKSRYRSLLQMYEPSALVIVGTNQAILSSGLNQATRCYNQVPLGRACFDDTKVGVSRATSLL